jgi:hypothetical protein
LTEKEDADIKRMSDERIRSRLSKEGYDKDLISAVKGRDNLLEMMVEVVVEKKREAERLAAEKEKDLAWRKQEAERLAAEKKSDLKKQEKELTLREQELIWKKEEAERLAAEKGNELELVRKRMEKEAEDTEAELRLKRIEIERQNCDDMKVKRFGDALRGCVAKMPSDVIDILPWFQSVEKMFSDFKIDEKYRVHLLKPYLTPDAVFIVSRMDVKSTSDFKAVKEALLHEFKLSASELLQSTLWKLKSETYIVYSNRLKSFLTYYLES